MSQSINWSLHQKNFFFCFEFSKIQLSHGFTKKTPLSHVFSSSVFYIIFSILFFVNGEIFKNTHTHTKKKTKFSSGDASLTGWRFSFSWCLSSLQPVSFSNCLIECQSKTKKNPKRSELKLFEYRTTSNRTIGQFDRNCC